MRLGIYGGSFDPIHQGHLAVARAARDAHALEEVRLVPAGRPPHKAGVVASPEDRLAMVELAALDEAGLVADGREIQRGGTSYTVETLEEISRERSGAELFFIVGADSVPELAGWRRVPDIFRLARVVAVCRAGFSLRYDPASFEGVSPAALERATRDAVDMEPVEVSSTELRRAIRTGEPWDRHVPSAVADYIRRHRLYSC